MSLSEIVEVVITKDSATVPRQAFGIVALLADLPALVFPERRRSFSSPDELVKNHPMLVGSAVYRAAKALYSDPSFQPDYFVVVRRNVDWDPATSENLGSMFSIALSRGSTPEPGSVVIEIDGVPVAEATYLPTTDVEDIEADLIKSFEKSGVPFYIGYNQNLLTIEMSADSSTYVVSVDTTGDVTATVTTPSTPPPPDEVLSTVMAEAYEQNPDFLGVGLVSNKVLDINEMASWVAGKRLMFHYRFNDPDGTGATSDASTNDIAAQMQGLAHKNIAGFYHSHSWLYAELAMLGPRINTDPDERATTWALYSPAGIPAPWYALGQTTAIQALKAKNANSFQRLGGRTVCLEGVSADGEYIDITFSEFWLESRLQERVFGRIQGAIQGGEKLGYDDTGASVLEAELRGQIQDAIRTNHVSASPEPVYYTPPRSSISAQTAATREYPAITATCQWKGAIHRAKFRITMI